MMPTLATLVYCLQDDRVLLLKRRKRPYANCWIAPGGKVEPLEAPAACAIRELKEETGLVATRILLRGVVREISPSPAWQWLLYLYVVPAFDGVALASCPEGELQWWKMQDLPSLLMPDADRIFLPAVIDLSRPPYEALFSYDHEETLVSVTEFCGDAAARILSW